MRDSLTALEMRCKCVFWGGGEGGPKAPLELSSKKWAKRAGVRPRLAGTVRVSDPDSAAVAQRPP